MAVRRVDGYTGELVGHAGSVSIRFERLPFTTKDGRQRFAHDDFGSELIEALYRVLPPAPSYFQFGAPKCQHCRNKLSEQPSSNAFAPGIDIEGLEPINMTVELPAARCETCGMGHRMGGRQTESDLSDAMIAAFEAAGLTY